MLESIARFSFNKYRLVISLWLLAIVLTVTAMSTMGSSWLEQGSLPNTESAKALEVLEAELPEIASQAGQMQGKIVFQAKDNIRNYAEEIESYLESIQAKSNETKVESVASPFDSENVGQISRDQKTAFANISFEENGEFMGVGQEVIDEASELRKEITVEFSGQVFSEFHIPNSEIIGIIAAIFILLIAFGSVVAAGLPILTALMGVAVGTSLVALFSHLFPIPEVTLNVAAMIGIGVGIDYSLFIITRYRVEIEQLKDRQLATIKAITTAGSAVFLAGMTVVISLLGMFIVNLDFTNGLAIGAASAVIVMVVASLTLVPALLGSPLGKNIDRFSLPHKHGIKDSPEFWMRWAGFIQKRAWIATVVGILILIVLTLPLFSLRTGVTDEGNAPSHLTTRRAYDILAESFGPGFNGPLLIVVDSRDNPENTDLYEIVREVERAQGVARVIPSAQELLIQRQSLAHATLNLIGKLDLNEEQRANVERLQDALTPDSEQNVAAIQVFPASAPQDEETANLVNDLRSDILPQVSDEETTIYVSGVTAANIDFADTMKQRLPFFVAAVLLFSFLLLMAVFRSVLVPIKAVILNLLSIGAAYGAMVAIFQWGWLRTVLGVGAPGPIEPWAPMLLFAIVFGLSMDYEVFLISKIREEYIKTKDNARAVKYGLSSTARVISAAALIMICVFGSFVLADDRILKLMGLGLAIAIFVDATIVRLILVPATMEILGDKNWWFPKWLDRIIPNINVESKTKTKN